MRLTVKVEVNSLSKGISSSPTGTMKNKKHKGNSMLKVTLLPKTAQNPDTSMPTTANCWMTKTWLKLAINHSNPNSKIASKAQYEKVGHS
jgi:hypothetical protein